MNRLLNIGFEQAGHWGLKDGALIFELSRHSTQRNILYAFICNGQVMYVGKTTQPLRTRMSGYKNPGNTQATNAANHSLIKSLLISGESVEILALPDNGLLHYGQFHLNLAAGLEDSIIKVLDPEWNGGVREIEPSPLTETKLTAPVTNHTFRLTLQQTYFKMGFFNVGVENSKYLGDDGQTIELFLGTQERPELGTINRTANTNGTPRIMGGTALREWFKINAEPLKELTVSVLSPTAIRINL
ncbi:MAG TPA: GIY-YIG nuclease family protein [Lacunisphaera sp.]|nr:GIY-YIG nuclease family protein [Lacunisphaera sp.]